MKSTRYSRPKGHVGTGLTFAMPFGFLGWPGLRAGTSDRGAAFLGWAFLNGTIQSVAVGWGVIGDCRALLATAGCIPSAI